jgi:type I restriction enzyme M protein
MAIKKSELYSSIWKSCDELRGGMDASQYKDYVLVLLFIKYISDKYAGEPYAQVTVPRGASFKDMVALKGKPTIGDDINKKILGPIAEANNLAISELPDFNSPDKLGGGKDMVDRLSNLITIFENPALDFSKNRAEGDDILGDAYEYLMRLFATESGKSKGNFYTPAEVSRIMAKIIGVNPNTLPSTTVYDPTCGSGSLLLKVADETENGLTIYGQEMDVATAALARMNMVIHKNATAEIAKGQSTLSNPFYLDESGNLKTFDFVVANPPFSYKAWTNGFTIHAGTVSDFYGRFTGYGVPPKKNGDYAFMLHLIASLKSKGKGAIILPHGVLFRGNSETEIRKSIILRGFIKGIIGLPPNLFYGTGIPACIIVLDKEDAEYRKGIFIIDASKSFMKDGNKNRIREQDIHKIVDVFNKQTDIEKYSRMVPVSEIEKNDFNLNIPRYIDSQEPEDIQDIEAHLLGDIPNADVDALKEYWDVCPSLKQILFSPGNRPNYSKLAVDREKIKISIYSHQEFITFSKKAQSSFTNWKVKNTPKLKSIAVGDKPKKLIQLLAEDLLHSFIGVSLIDKYDIYQHLLTYWMETMQDDEHELVANGWEVGREIDKDPKKKDGWQGRLIPKQLLISRYFNAEQKAIEKMEVKRDEITRQMEEMQEEHGGEEGLLSELINDRGKIVKADIQKHIKEIKDDPDSTDELKVLKEYQKLLEQESEVNKKIKESQAALEKKLLEKYKVLTVDEIKMLVVEDKWLAKLEQDIQTEIQRGSQRLTRRITELAERYEKTLSSLTTEVSNLEKKVQAHLDKMGFSWK